MIICNKCGQELPDEAAFCASCGAKIEKKTFCMNCGKEILDGAKFCMHCGTQVGNEIPTIKSKKIESIDVSKTTKNGKRREDSVEGPKTSGPLGKALSELDPVVWHREYYGHGFSMLVSEPVAFYNNGWMLFSHNFNESDYHLRRVQDDYQIDINVPSKEYDEILGINNEGIWYAVNDKEDHIGKIVLINPEKGIKETIQVDQLDRYYAGVYIYGTEVYYIRKTDTRIKIVVTDIHSQVKKTLLDVKNSNDSDEWRLSDLVVGAQKVAIYDEGLWDDSGWSYVDNPGWHIIDKESGKEVFIDEEALGFKIFRLDMTNKVLWGSMTENERAAIQPFYPEKDLRNCILARSYTKIIEGSYLVYKNNQKPVIWDVGHQTDKCYIDELYFDGDVMYQEKNHNVLIRIDRDGRKFTLDSGDGSGKTNELIVAEQYLYNDYDASYRFTRLPNHFSSFSGRSDVNTEAKRIFWF